METIIKTLEEDIKELDKTCKGLKISSSDYAYWNGCRCQANKILKDIKQIKHTQ